MTFMKAGLALWALACAFVAVLPGETIPAATPTAALHSGPESRVQFLCSVQAPYGQWGPFTQFISGLNSSAYSLVMTAQQQSQWNNYSKRADSDWKGLQARYLKRIDNWRERSLRDAPTGNVGFYPFGGPDAANLLAFFPDAREYILIGLEPVGCVPAGLADYTRDYFSDLRRSLESVTTLGFFKTNDMHRDFAESSVNGVLPLLLFLVDQAGYLVTDVTPISITTAGVITTSANQPSGETRGVAIKFTDGRHGMRTLRYFSLNLLDSRIRNKPGTLKYFGNIAEANTLVKDASYLMHTSYFSIIRNVILSHSRMVVEDDTGLPFRFFEQTAWDVRLYGSYAEPIHRFGRWHQEDLKAAFIARADEQPLDFAIGYRHRDESSLLVATRRGK
jgi:hypothetical protein